MFSPLLYCSSAARPVPPLLQSRSDMSPEDIVSLQLALVDLALRVYTDKIHYVDKVLQHTVDIFGGREIVRCVEGGGGGWRKTGQYA